MNLFAARLTGKMSSTEKFEANMREMTERVLRYRQVEKSPEMAEYLALKEEVEDSAFQEKKQQLSTRKYKDTEEGRKTAYFEKLKSSSQMKDYEAALANPDFKAFLAFRETDEFSKVNSAEERKKSPQIKKFYDIYQSSQYKNYLKVLNSSELQQYNELKAEIETEDFKKRNAFWADEKRWQNSEEYKKDQRYNELKANEEIKFYFSQRAEDIDWAELFRPIFEDLMVNNKNWKPGFGYPSDKLKDGHSRTSEHQAYNNGHNAFFAEGRMDIETREETQKAVAWDEKKGFVEHVFSYTSDAMNTKDIFQQEEGMFMAKVRTQGAGHHLFGISTGEPGKPVVALYHYNGKRHQLGLIDGKNSQMVDLTGVLRSMYHVYTFRWTKEELTWYVNDMEVLKIKNTLPKEQMFFIAQSFLPKDETPGEGKLKVQWARAFKTAGPIVKK
ncbi:MAG: family 16 glycosylhydrolase [Paludibacteraceae bacterium]|nr:family 16 glycosylhydrolase [Paludibacteraceae bacterium]